VSDRPVPRKVALKPATGQRRKVDYSSELNAEQLGVVMHPDGPMLVLAGAAIGRHGDRRMDGEAAVPP